MSEIVDIGLFLCWPLVHQEILIIYTMPMVIFIPHEQCERGKVIGVGVHIYVCGPNIFESYFSDRLTFS